MITISVNIHTMEGYRNNQLSRDYEYRTNSTNEMILPLPYFYHFGQNSKKEVITY